MNRRVFLRRAAVTLGVLGLSGCGLLETPSPTPAPSETPSPSPSPTATRTPFPTRTPTETPTSTPTPTVTPRPVQAGTPPAGPGEVINEANLAQVVELARWGKGSVRGLAWAPSGTALAVASDLGVFLYEPLTLQQTGSFDAGPTSRLAFFPGGTPLVSAGEKLLRWDVASGQSQGLALLPNPIALQIASDGTRIALLSQPAGFSAQLQLNGGPGVALKDSQEPLEDAVISADLSLVAAHIKGGPARIWRADGEKLLDLPPGPLPPGPLVIAPDTSAIAVAYADTSVDFLNHNFIRLYAIPTGQPLYDLYPQDEAENTDQALVSLAFAADGKHLAAGAANNSVYTWRTEPGPPERRLKGSGPPAPLVYSPDNLLLAGGGLDTWRVSDGVRLASQGDHFAAVHDLALSPNGEIAALAMVGRIELRLVADGSLLRSIDSPRQVNGLSFSPDGLLLCGACSDGTARLWRVRDGRYLTLIGEPTNRLWAAAFSPDGKTILIGGENGLIQFYDIEKNAITLKVKEPYISTRLAFSPVGTLFASLTSSGANVRDMSGSLTRTLAGVGLQDMAYSPDGGWLAIAGNELLRVIDMGSGKDIYSIYNPARGRPASLAYSSDGAFLAVGNDQGQIDFYWAGDGTFLRTLSGHRGRVIRLRFTPDTRRLLSAGQDGTLRVWGLE